MGKRDRREPVQEVLMRLLLRFVVLNAGAVVLLGACTSARPPVVESRQNGAAVRDARLGMHSKAVLTKKEPDTFLAEDGTICRVSEDRFKDTAAHSLVYCNWQ
jgi:hypothetical protein